MTVIVALLLRAVFRIVDGAALLHAPALWRAWWVGWRGLPSPYRADFASTLAARARGVPEGDLVYGESFVVVARRLLRSVGVGEGSVVVDLGCGRGAALVAARALGAQARGIELSATSVAVVAPALAAAGVDVIVGDAGAVEVDDATHVWLAWATWSDATRARVAVRLRTLRPGAIVVSVVHAVDDAAFVVVARSRAPFSWGIADVVVSRRVVDGPSALANVPVGA